jgi:hypothetical protein
VSRSATSTGTPYRAARRRSSSSFVDLAVCIPTRWSRWSRWTFRRFSGSLPTADIPGSRIFAPRSSARRSTPGTSARQRPGRKSSPSPRASANGASSAGARPEGGRRGAETRFWGPSRRVFRRETERSQPETPRSCRPSAEALLRRFLDGLLWDTRARQALGRGANREEASSSPVKACNTGHPGGKGIVSERRSTWPCSRGGDVHLRRFRHFRQSTRMGRM